MNEEYSYDKTQYAEFKHQTPRVVVIGDVVLDIYIHGPINRLNPEEPGCPLLTREYMHYAPGAAGNVAANLATLGARTSLVSDLDVSYEGRKIQGLLADQGVTLHMTNTLRPQPIRTRYYANGRQMLRVDHDAKLPLAINTRMRQVIDEAVMKADVVLVVDYDKGFVTPPLMEHIIDAVSAARIPYVVGTKVADWRKYGRPLMFCCNEAEWEQHTPPLCTKPAAMSAVVTQGQHGCSRYTSGDSNNWRFVAKTPTVAVRCPQDSIGVGDTFLAALVKAMYLNDCTVNDTACHIANAAARAAVQCEGTAMVSLDSVEEEMAVLPACAETE